MSQLDCQCALPCRRTWARLR